MAILPENLVSKIMTYISHPVADLFKAQVSFMPGVIDDPDVILIGVHDGNHMFKDHRWFSKEHECLHYSTTMEEFVIFNKLKSIMIQIKTYDTFDCPKFKMVGYMIANLDPIIWHAHLKTIERVYMNNRSRFYSLLTESDEELDKLLNEHEEYWSGRRPAESSDGEESEYELDI